MLHGGNKATQSMHTNETCELKNVKHDKNCDQKRDVQATLFKVNINKNIINGSNEYKQTNKAK